jgi:hypothetical protein
MKETLNRIRKRAIKLFRSDSDVPNTNELFNINVIKKVKFILEDQSSTINISL